jgi:hypothetical protein
LKDEVRAMVAMKRPNNLDTACSLALLHEDVWIGRREGRRIENHGMSKGYQKNSLVAGNSVPMASHRGLPQNDERRRTNSSSYKAKDSKLAALKAYRRAKGLCFKYGERWNPNHTRSNSVPLHVVEEMWAITSQVAGEIEVDGSESQLAPEDEEVVLAVTIAAASGSENNKTIRLWASIHNKQMLVLVDSRSSASFMSLYLMGDIKNVQQLPRPLPVKVVDGRNLWSDCWAPQCPWLCGGIIFHTNFKFLPLSGYDIILGMDWLEGYNPMSVYWAEKKLEFCYQGQIVQLQEIQPKLDSCIPLSDKQLRGLLSKEVVEHMFELRPAEESESCAIPEQIAKVLEHYQEYFCRHKDCLQKECMTIPYLCYPEPHLLGFDPIDTLHNRRMKLKSRYRRC